MDGYLIRELDGIRRPDIKDYNQVINYQAFEKGLYYEMPERSICVLNNEADLGLLLLTPFPLFHAEARKSLDLFLWDCRYREYVFLDQKNNRSERYYLPFFLPINGSVDRGTAEWRRFRFGYRKEVQKMADYDKGVTGQEGYGSVYDYIEANYRDEWSELDVKSGILVDWGLVAANRWEQFESTYRSNYADYSADYTSDAEFQSRMARKYQEMQEYYQIYEVPAEEQVDVFSDMDIQNAVREEMEKDAMEKASDSAALAAFETIGEGVLQMDHEERQAESEKALEASTESKNSRTNQELEEALKEKAEDNPEYLVRGAPLRCRYGSHMRYLDMLEAHGVYLKDDPVMHRKDCKVGENILPFGICTSPVHNLKKREIGRAHV